MSGGSYEYKYREIEELAEMLSPQKREHQDIRERMAIALRDIANQCHDIEWVDSGDYGSEYWPLINDWLNEHNF